MMKSGPESVRTIVHVDRRVDLVHPSRWFLRRERQVQPVRKHPQ